MCNGEHLMLPHNIYNQTNCGCLGLKGFQKNNKLPRMSGKNHTKETRDKQAMSKVGNKNPMKDVNVAKRVSATRIRLGIGKGSKNWNWKGGITPENESIRHSHKYKVWRDEVFKRDNYTCQHCKQKCGNGVNVILHAHHIKSFTQFKDLRFEVVNGITLCKQCHYILHTKERHD